jgi:hypothetical protein
MPKPKFVLLHMLSEYHEDGIICAYGPFQSEEDANGFKNNRSWLVHTYAVELRSPKID